MSKSTTFMGDRPCHSHREKVLHAADFVVKLSVRLDSQLKITDLIGITPTIRLAIS
jgi:hypothetical protein